MNNLFTLFRYLANNKNADPHNPYTVAYRALDALLDLLGELEYWGKKVRKDGGFEYDDANRLTTHVTDGFKTALLGIIVETPVQAIVDLIESSVKLEDYDTLLTLIEQSKAEAEKVMQEQENPLGDLDNYPF